ncbi:MAG: arsenate reductase ArsC [Gemmatimonadota bacterium]|nr:arsenate reductase ArsC [Gemmatimonadota bacterium]MDE3216351.1 arsenate reductase ArsC [Gemmatimonadota bacterium]
MTDARPLGVLFLCTGNSARSQIAEALLVTMGRGRFRVGSAGTKPAERVNPGAIAVLCDHGIDWVGRRPKTIDEIHDEPWDLVITVCDDAKESCPVFPGHPTFAHWGMPDPAAVDDGAARTQAFRETYETLRERIERFLSERPSVPAP